MSVVIILRRLSSVFPRAAQARHEEALKEAGKARLALELATAPAEDPAPRLAKRREFRRREEAGRLMRKDAREASAAARRASLEAQRPGLDAALAAAAAKRRQAEKISTLSTSRPRPCRAEISIRA